MRQRGGAEDEVRLSLEYLHGVVDAKLARASEQVIRAVQAHPEVRALELNFARADYGVAFAIAALIDERVTSANEWPRFGMWVWMLAEAARL